MTNEHDPVPPWAHAVGRLHGLGVLSVARYQHVRVPVTPAFVRRLRRVERRALAAGLPALARLAHTLWRGPARYGCRGATDTWMGLLPAYLQKKLPEALAASPRGRERHARFFVATITTALSDLAAVRTGARTSEDRR